MSPPETSPKHAPLRPSAATVFGHVLAWTGVAVAYTLATLVEAQREGRELDPLVALLRNLSFWTLWPLFTLVIDLALRRRPVLRRRRGMLILTAVSVVLFLIPQAVIAVLLNAHYGDRPIPTLFGALGQIHAYYLFLDSVVMLGAIACVYALAILRDQLALERAHAQATAEALTLRVQLERQRLSRLQAQLEPHFMFNALNAITGLVRGGDSDAALTAIARLSDLLRSAVQGSRDEWSTLGDEHAFVEGYLALQQLRFGDRLRVRIEVDPALAHRPCPALLLQPLVENAVRHGIEPLREPGDVVLRVRAVPGGSMVFVGNPLPPGTPEPGFGVGLASVRERLALIYAGRARLDAGPRGDRFEVELLLPEPADD